MSLAALAADFDKGAAPELFGEGNLVKYLKAAILKAKDTPATDLERLDQCWKLIDEERWEEKLARYLGLQKGDQRLKDFRCYLKGLFATAAAAIYFRRLREDGSDPRELRRWMGEAAALLDGQPAPAGHGAAIDKDFGRYIERLTSEGWAIMKSSLWIRWWLDEGGSFTREIEVPIAGITDTDSYILHLRFFKVPGNQHELIRHPDSALIRVSETFMKPLRELATSCPFPVCWGVRLSEKSEFRAMSFDGTSASGAAARAIHDLSKDKYPDDGVLVLAKVNTDALAKWNFQWDLLELEEVRGIPAKLEAAEREPSIETVIIARAGKLEVLDRVGTHFQARPET